MSPRPLPLAGLLLLLLAPILLAPSLAHAEGAMAASRDGRVGIGFNYRSSDDADERALQECGRGCRVVSHFRNQCGALASGREGGYGYAWARRLEAAEERALDNCRNEGGRGCTVRARGCDDR